MSERILRALLQLFAIGASLERLTMKSRVLVEQFLKQQISLHRVAEYLDVFDGQLAALQGVDDPARTRKKIAVSSVKALRICTEINKELNTRQKYIVFMRLVQFMNSSDEEMTAPEREFLDTVSSVFTIGPEDHTICLALAETVLQTEKLDSDQVLVAGSQLVSSSGRAKFLRHADTDGQLVFVYIRRAGIFFLRYSGRESLTVNGQPVLAGVVTVFAQGAVLRGQKIQPLYFSDILRCFMEGGEKTDIRFETRELEFTFKNGKKGLHSLTFRAGSGQMIGVMGSSGAGKSTLLNVLNGTARPSSGNIFINGTDLYENHEKSDGLIGNIPQDDLLIEELTVFQNLFYNTRLVYGDLDDLQISRKVMDTLESLGLTETRDLRVGNPLNKTISGGQRKRLNIALELIREPSILFVDEPTSGLSSRDAENVMDLLKQLALTGKLVFVVIHQPSSDIFRLFDRLLILDTGGYPVYFGNAPDSLIYFRKQIGYADADQGECPACGNINPEQLFNIIELKEVDEFGNQTKNRRITPEEWNRIFINNATKESSTEDGQTHEVPHVKKAGILKQFRTFFSRDFMSKLSNRQYLMINLLEAPLLSGILACILRYSRPGEKYIFSDNPNIPAWLFICVIVSLFLGLSVSAEEIIRDRKILQREKFLHLSRNSYLFAKITLMFFLSAIQAMSFILIGNLILGIHDMWGTYFLVLFSISCFANLLGLNISSALDSVVTIYILIPFLIIPQILLSGVIVRFEKLNPVITRQGEVPFIGDIMASRWAFEALSVAQFRDNPFEKLFFPMDAVMSQATYRKDWWLPVMRERIDKASRLLTEGHPPDSVRDVLVLVKNELNDPALVLPSSFNSHSIAQMMDRMTLPQTDLARDFLNSVKEYYIRMYAEASDKKERKINALTSGQQQLDSFNILKQEYQNESLDEMVRNSNTTERISVYNNHIIQRYEPVYKIQPGQQWIRSIFFAPVKNLFGKTTDTFVVNLCMVWLMTFLLYITLRTDALRRIISSVSTRRKKTDKP
ncbi:MAG: ATP-binding cassette domain-containing protein [Bacteroidia bacterium]|nr:ATP-binding cassette domain-containing protein [Bacteroidia bacterium]